MNAWLCVASSSLWWPSLATKLKSSPSIGFNCIEVNIWIVMFLSYALALSWLEEEGVIVSQVQKEYFYSPMCQCQPSTTWSTWKAKSRAWYFPRVLAPLNAAGKLHWVKVTIVPWSSFYLSNLCYLWTEHQARRWGEKDGSDVLPALSA